MTKCVGIYLWLRLWDGVRDNYGRKRSCQCTRDVGRVARVVSGSF